MKNLKYVKPTAPRIEIVLEKLTEPELEFLQKHLPNADEDVCETEYPKVVFFMRGTEDCPVPEWCTGFGVGGEEITFSDIFVEEPSKDSIMSEKNPVPSLASLPARWVTANITTWCPGLTHDKDYKVICDLSEADEPQYIIYDDDGVKRSFHTSHFYPKPTKEDLLPVRKLPEKEGVVEEEDGFEDLVYEEPKEDVYIEISALSDAQLTFLEKNLPNKDNWKKASYENLLGFEFNGKAWMYDNTYDKEVSFNDIFIPNKRMKYDI